MSMITDHRFDPGDHDPALVDDDHLCHDCGKPRSEHAAWPGDRPRVPRPTLPNPNVGLTTGRTPTPTPPEPNSQVVAVTDPDPPATPAQIERYRYGFVEQQPLTRHLATPWGVGRDKKGVVWEYDLLDWSIRVAFLILGVVIGVVLAHIL